MENKNPTEFIALMALLMAIAAFSIDALMPALPLIGNEFNTTNINDNQLLISLVFLGLAIGQLFFGPLSDSLGRKPAVYYGLAIFLMGSLLSVFAKDFNMMLMSRLIQGIGLGAPRTVGLAMVRDKYAGDAMARIMSFIMVIFILVPTVAPAMGQAMLYFSDWKSIFFLQIGMAFLILIWFYLRQPETLTPQNIIPFSFFTIGKAVLEIFKTRSTLAYTLIMGVIQGGFIVYLSSAQQIFQDQYGLGDKFPLVFAILALAIGVASLVNSKLVMKYGMDKMARWSLIAFTIISAISTMIFLSMPGQNPSLLVFMIYLILLLFSTGILFGNLNALAMRPLGHIAGLGSTVVGFVSTLISVPLGIYIGRFIQDTAFPLVIGFGLAGVVSLLILLWLKGEKKYSFSNEQFS
jgi:DHA1 family bicyclomycin/chloramphenicol resistance-like MFS transporter